MSIKFIQSAQVVSMKDYINILKSGDPSIACSAWGLARTVGIHNNKALEGEVRCAVLDQCVESFVGALRQCERHYDSGVMGMLTPTFSPEEAMKIMDHWEDEYAKSTALGISEDDALSGLRGSNVPAMGRPLSEAEFDAIEAGYDLWSGQA